MSQIVPIYIPVYIASQTYQPARVLPRLLFYNGVIECETYYIKNESNSSQPQPDFPYFDNYSVVSGSQFPTQTSRTLLFQNENPSYGSAPTASLYSEYWENYINLLYNPVTRLLNASAIIPLKDYFDMELNDVVNFRGNYYHLRAINDYSLKTGECTIQLLGPIIPDTLNDTINIPPTTTTTTTSTTSTTTTSTTTTTISPGCFTYEYGPAMSGCTINWTNCDGSAGSTFVSVGNYYTIPCMREGSGTGCGAFVKGAVCGTTTTTTTTTTTAPPYYSFLLNSTAGELSGPDACSDYSSFNRATYYSSGTNGPTIVNGTFLYTDTGLTTPIPDGYRSNGTTYWNFSGGDTGDSGTAC